MLDQALMVECLDLGQVLVYAHLPVRYMGVSLMVSITVAVSSMSQ